jgi:hypothetical protein
MKLTTCILSLVSICEAHKAERVRDKFNVPGKYTLFADLQGGGKAQQVFEGRKDHSCDYTGTVTTPCGSETANLFGLTCTVDDPHVYGFPGAQGYKLDFGPLISSCSWQMTAFGFEIQVTAGGLPNYRSVLCEDLACSKVHFIDGDAMGTGAGYKLY